MPGSASGAELRFRRLGRGEEASTPRAISGDTHSVSSAVINPSRPNGVLNHGIPAYGYTPYAVSVSIIRKSPADRLIQRLRLSFELTTRHSPTSR